MTTSVASSTARLTNRCVTNLMRRRHHAAPSSSRNLCGRATTHQNNRATAMKRLRYGDCTQRTDVLFHRYRLLPDRHHFSTAAAAGDSGDEAQPTKMKPLPAARRKALERELDVVKEEIDIEARAAETGERTGSLAPRLSFREKKQLWKRNSLDVTVISILQWLDNVGRSISGALSHTWHGFKLFGVELKISWRLIWAQRKRALTRREKRQLARSMADVFRMVPFSVFVLVPMLEFLLPLYIWLFPWMMPSTFQDQTKEERNVRNKLKVRIEMAKVLQDALEEMHLDRKLSKGESNMGLEFSQFMRKIRLGGQRVSNEELLKFSKYFEDELTIDNLAIPQLRALCRIVNVFPHGTEGFLRFQLNSRLQALKAEDHDLEAEGVENLTEAELQAANRARGMRALGIQKERLQEQLKQWLELSLNDKVPPSLLLLSRTLYLPEEISAVDRINSVISGLPETIGLEAKLKLQEISTGKQDYKAKLDIVRTIEAALKQERLEAKKLKEEEAKKEAARKEAEAEEVRRKEIEGLLMPDHAEAAAHSVTGFADAAIQTAQAAEEETENIAKEELEVVEHVIESALSAKGKMGEMDLAELKTEIKEYADDLEEARSLIVLKGGRAEESKAAKALRGKVEQLIKRADKEQGKLLAQMHEARKNESSAAIPSTSDAPTLGDLARHVQHVSGEEAAGEVNKPEIVHIGQLILALRRLKRVPNDVREERVIEVLHALDSDHDGNINAELALKVIELIGRENILISPDQMTEIITLLRREQLSEQEAAEEASVEDASVDIAKDLSDMATSPPPPAPPVSTVAQKLDGTQPPVR